MLPETAAWTTAGLAGAGLLGPLAAKGLSRLGTGGAGGAVSRGLMLGGAGRGGASALWGKLAAGGLASTGIGLAGVAASGATAYQAYKMKEARKGELASTAGVSKQQTTLWDEVKRRMTAGTAKYGEDFAGDVRRTAAKTVGKGIDPHCKPADDGIIVGILIDDLHIIIPAGFFHIELCCGIQPIHPPVQV